MTRYIKDLDPSTITTRKPRIPGMANPKPEHLAAAGWRTIETIPIPEGYTAEGATYTAHPDRADIAIETETGRLTSEIEAEREAQAAAEFQQTLDRAETEVRMLAAALAQIGLTIPCGGKAGAIRHIRNLPPGTLPAGALGDLDALYQAALAACGSDEMLTLIWEAIKQADAQ